MLVLVLGRGGGGGRKREREGQGEGGLRRGGGWRTRRKEREERVGVFSFPTIAHQSQDLIWMFATKTIMFTIVKLDFLLV